MKFKVIQHHSQATWLRGLLVAGAAGLVLSACGASDSTSPNPGATRSPPTAPTPTPAPTPTADPLDALKAQCGQPEPPPLYGMKLGVQVDNGFRKLIDSRPIVDNVGRGTADSYCGKVGFDPGARYCDTRLEGHPQRVACDILVVGKAADTGRYGPTWSRNGQPCVEPGSQTDPGCTNHPDNQFLAVMRGNGEILACASDVWPATGARCGGCLVNEKTGGECAN
jgi:hypothetical protein